MWLCWQSALNVQGCRCWSVQIGQFPPVALSVPLGISNKCDRLPLSNGGVQVSVEGNLTTVWPAFPFSGAWGVETAIRRGLIN